MEIRERRPLSKSGGHLANVRHRQKRQEGRRDRERAGEEKFNQSGAEIGDYVLVSSIGREKPVAGLLNSKTPFAIMVGTEEIKFRHFISASVIQKGTLKQG